MIAAARATIKFFGFLLTAARALFDYFVNVRPKGATLPLRADWCHRWAITHLRLLNVELTTKGTPPARGMLACNHLSYLDIVALAAVHPQIFLSKAEVKNWPLIGVMTQCAGTLFIRRERKADVAELQNAFETVVAQDVPITIFPEGTSSDGSKVLPFYSSLLEPAAKSRWPVTPGWIEYQMDDGDVGQDVCYWGDMTFGPHFLKLLSKKRIRVKIIFGEPLPAGLNRKQMAAQLHEAVSILSVKNRERTPGLPLATTMAI